MAETHNVEIRLPQLVRNAKYETKFIELPPYPIVITIQVTTKNEKVITKTAKDRIKAVAMSEIERYEKTVIDVAKMLDKKVEKIFEYGFPDDNELTANRAVKSHEQVIKNALAGVQDGVNKVVKELLAREAKNNTLLTESNIVCVAKITISSIKLSKSVIVLVSTAGTALIEYKNAAEAIYKICKEVHDSFITLADRKKKLLVLLDGVKSKDGTNVKVISKDAVKKAREDFRNSCEKLRRQADTLSEKADKMNQKIKKNAKLDTFKTQIQLTKSCIDMRRRASEINKPYQLEIKALDEIETAMKKAGINVVDKTFRDKLKKIKMPTFKDIEATVSAMRKILE